MRSCKYHIRIDADFPANPVHNELRPTMQFGGYILLPVFDHGFGRVDDRYSVQSQCMSPMLGFPKIVLPLS